MILVICEPEDSSGLWLVNEITRRGHAVQHVLPDELVIGSRLSLRVSNLHDLAMVELADGRSFSSSDLSGVINRMTSFPRPVFDGMADQDVVYIGEEVRAAIVAWFAALQCPVLNPPAPYSASGMVLHESSWRRQAGLHGIKAAPLKLDADGYVDQPANMSVVVIGDKVAAVHEGSVPGALGEASVTLAHTMGFRLLGMDFSIDEAGDWEFLRAHVMPDLMPTGSDGVDALLAEMVQL